MSGLLLAVAVLPRLSGYRLALLAFCGVGGVALVASSSAGADTPGERFPIQVVNNTKSSLPCCAVQLEAGRWAVVPQGTSLAAGATDGWVAQLNDDELFAARVDYGAAYQGPGFVGGGEIPFSVTCESEYPSVTCQVQNPTKTTPWTVTFTPWRDDATAPVVQVRVARSLVEESVRAAGVPVVVRSNEPARARVELIAQNGARHGLLARTLKWDNRDYPLMVRLNRAGLRVLDVGRLYRLRVWVTDYAGNRARPIERRIFIR
jgi:hypothetical protein